MSPVVAAKKSAQSAKGEAARTVPPDQATAPQHQSPKSETLSSTLRSLARNLLTKELVLGPDPAIAERARETTTHTPQVERTLMGTIGGSMGLLWKEAPAILLNRVALATSVAALPIASSWLTGKLVGTVTESVNATAGMPGAIALTATGAIAAIGTYSILQDFIGRYHGLFNGWEWRRTARLTSKLASKVTNSWTFEELEDNKKRLSLERFKEHSGRLYGMVMNASNAFSSIVGAGAAAALLAGVDYRLSMAAGAFLGCRVWRDMREAKTSFSLEKQSTQERRRLYVKERLSTTPALQRDMRQVGKQQELQDDFQNGMEKVHYRELQNERRVQTIRLTYDLVPATLVATSFALVAQQFAQGILKPEAVVTMIGYAWSLVGQCRGVGYEFGQMTQAQTFAAECLDFLASEREKDPTKQTIPLHKTPPHISLRDVTVIRGEEGQTKKILDVPKLEIKPGEIIGIVGQEGAGKSTLLKVLLGMREVNSGQVDIRWGDDSYDLSRVEISSWQTHIGNSSQDFFSPEGMRVKEISQLGADRRPREQEMTHTEAIRLSRVDEFLKKTPGNDNATVGAGWQGGVDFSGGQRKLIGLVLALRSNAPLLVLDEPSANISKQTAAAILSEVCEKARQEGRTVLIVSHNFENFSYCDRILSVENGQIVQDGPAEIIAREPGPYRDGLLAAANQSLEQLGLDLDLEQLLTVDFLS